LREADEGLLHHIARRIEIADDAQRIANERPLVSIEEGWEEFRRVRARHRF
jgi:hypothetical protein